jgi:hypothetical protein
MPLFMYAVTVVDAKERECRLYAALKAASHEVLQLVPSNLVHMSTCIGAIDTAAPPGLQVDSSMLKQKCGEMYNREIITSHSGHVRGWINRQRRSEVATCKPEGHDSCIQLAKTPATGTMHSNTNLGNTNIKLRATPLRG